MALTRKFLMAMGIEGDKIDEIISAHVETVNGLTEKRDEYKAKADRLDDVEKELAALKKSTENHDDIAAELEAVKKKFEDYKKDVEWKAERTAKETAFKKLLEKVGVPKSVFDTKLFKQAMKAETFEGLDFDDKGEVKADKKTLESVKAEWSAYIPTVTEVGANVANPPSNTGGSTFEKMSLSEKMIFANENPDNAEVKAWIGN